MNETIVIEWEYLVIPFAEVLEDIASERTLNELGREGWELVSVAILPAARIRQPAVAYLKRRKANSNS